MGLYELEEANALPSQMAREAALRRAGWVWALERGTSGVGASPPHFPASILKTQREEGIRRQVQFSSRKTANRQDLNAPGMERGEVLIPECGCTGCMPLGSFIQQTFPEASYFVSSLALGPGTQT